MSGFIEFLEDYLHERLSDIDIGMIGRIEAFDSQKMRADVIPLLKKKSGDQEIEYSMIKDVPVSFLYSGGFYIRPAYRKGDLVHISFSTHDIEKALKDDKPLASNRIFSTENSFVTGGIAKTDWKPPSDISKEGLLVGHKDGGVLTQYKKDELLHKVGNTSYKMTPTEVCINDGAFKVSI
jgi:Phage protein Gp138 N-terminal domain